VRQDEDVLDTWFSSWLWPISTLGWPGETAPDLDAFYPTDTLVTAPEILFFWVARMVMAGYEFMGRAPYHTVYLHGTARDTQHRKMSKSLGNGIDPLDVVKLYGADALRWTLVAGMGMGADVILDPADIDKSFATGRNFVTKLWNIGRFLLDRVGTEPVARVSDFYVNNRVDNRDGALTRADHWILHRLRAAIDQCDVAIGPLRPEVEKDSPDQRVWRELERNSGLRLNEYAEAARRFVWNELADWYLESLKSRLDAEGDDREVARAVLVHTFDYALRLLHPIVPFVTEALWQKLPGHEDGTFLATAEWPDYLTGEAREDEAILTGDPEVAEEFELVREAVLAIRQIRAENNVAPGKSIEVVLRAADTDLQDIFGEEAATVGRLTRADVRIADGVPVSAAAHAVLSGGTEVIVPLAGLIDVTKECARLRSEVAQLTTQIGSREARLSNAKYLERAPADVVASDRAILDEMKSKREQLTERVRSLCGG
jgi:valyl-tRNA synthetase